MKKYQFENFIFLSTFIVSFSLFSQEIDRDFHKNFDVDKGAILHLEHGDGNVTVTPWNKDEVDVTVRYRAEFKTIGIGGGRRDFDVEFRQSGDDVYVIGKEKGRGGVTIGVHTSRRFEYTYKIKAPSYMELDFKGDDGDIEISDWESNVLCNLDDGDIELKDVFCERTKIKSDDGKIHITNLTGELFVNADDSDISLYECEMSDCNFEGDDGEIRLNNCKGSFNIQVDDGDIRFKKVQTKELQIKVDDADIDLDLLKTDRIDLYVLSDNGNVLIDLERGISATFSVDTDDGRIRVNLPNVDEYDEGRHHKSGEIYGGKGKIRIRTSDGDVTLNEKR